MPHKSISARKAHQRVRWTHDAEVRDRLVNIEVNPFRAAAIRGRLDGNASDPGPDNSVLLHENPDSNSPPVTDAGDVGSIWYSFDLAKKRLQGGGWTHQVTDRELPTSKEIAGVTMRLTPGSFREMHWHTADEWAYNITGTTRVTVLQPDGKIFIDDVGPGDLWYFPAGYPHSLQGIGDSGCEFLLVFDDGNFSEDDTFLLTDWLAHTPRDVVMKNMGWSADEYDQLPQNERYIFEATVPKSLEEVRREAGEYLVTDTQYTYKLSEAKPTVTTPGGVAKIVDSTNFPVSQSIAAGLVRLDPGALRELHWHPTGTEWQFYLQGSARMTVFGSGGRARTMNFNANDVGYVPSMAGHYIENVGSEEVLFLEVFRTSKFVDVSLNNWIRRVPLQTVMSHLNLSETAIGKVPSEKHEILPPMPASAKG